MGIAETEGGLPLFDTDNLKIFMPTAEIIARLMGKIGANVPAADVLKEVIRKDENKEKLNSLRNS